MENDVNAWNAVVPAVCMLKDFFDFYDEFQRALLDVIGFVCEDDPFISLPENLLSAKLIVNMFDFIIKFDELKMGKVGERKKRFVLTRHRRPFRTTSRFTGGR